MQPWRNSAGLTAALAGSAVLVCGSRLEFLAPFWRVILADYGLSIVAHLGLVLTAVAAALLRCRRRRRAGRLGTPGRSGRALGSPRVSGSERSEDSAWARPRHLFPTASGLRIADHPAWDGVNLTS